VVAAASLSPEEAEEGAGPARTLWATRSGGPALGDPESR
jgi:hypothetical protein